eukprot:CAMPEP_0185018352 /NCGR_PEP_ID=MMETSP1103-20130426/1108_1 /TAXON_ID=36769 /ORGANISM="Paraphysomonas bandaiensis, Strain Caron Lab Isolate" /LENGTH=199 /DNA_ID=CAMNT_0027548139 /DNA_START=64 /DNA_END=660 /DNA_ORIENTATION=-
MGDERAKDYVSYRPNSQQYGWFEDFEVSHDIHESFTVEDSGVTVSVDEEPVRRALSLPPPATDPPVYILESTLDSQHLWYTTAGTRPRQPIEEKKFYEQQWRKNFAESKVIYADDATATDAEPRENLKNLQIEFNEDVLFRGRGPFSNAVSKSFMGHCLSCLTVQIPRFKIVRSREQREGYHAQFLVAVSIGSVTHGVW